MKNLKTISEVTDLSLDEISDIHGGESGWYPALYLIGKAVRFIQGALENPPTLPSGSVYK